MVYTRIYLVKIRLRRALFVSRLRLFVTLCKKPIANGFRKKKTSKHSRRKGVYLPCSLGIGDNLLFRVYAKFARKLNPIIRIRVSNEKDVRPFDVNEAGIRRISLSLSRRLFGRAMLRLCEGLRGPGGCYRGVIKIERRVPFNWKTFNNISLSSGPNFYLLITCIEVDLRCRSVFP